LNLKNFFLLLGAGIILSLLGASPIQARNSAEALRAYGRGERLVKQGKTDAAIKEFEKAVRQAPANLGMRTRLAWLLSDQGRPQAAIPHFHFILARRPQDKNALLGLAIAQMRLGYTEKAVPVLDKGLRSYPGDALLLQIKGEALGSRPETAALAVKVYEELARLQPQNPEWPRQRRAATLKAAAHSYHEALADLREGKRQPALKALEKAIKYDPESVGYRTHYGWVLLEEGQPALASQAFSEVLQRDPRQREAHLGLAIAQLGVGDAPGALTLARRGLEYFPHDEKLLEVEADAAAARKETRDTAAKTYEHLLTRRPKDNRLQLKFAKTLVAHGQTDKGEEIFKEILEKEPGNLEARLGMARISMGSLDFGSARADYKKVLASAPENPEAQQGLRHAQEFMRPQIQTFGGYFEDSESFQRSYVYSSFRYYLTDHLIAALGYGYLVYDKSDGFLAPLREREIHRHVLPLQFQYRPFRNLVLEAAGAFSDYGSFGKSAAARASAYCQMTQNRGMYLYYSYYDVIDPSGPFNGPWGRHLDAFPEYQKYRYWLTDPMSFWAQNIYGSSSTRAIIQHIRANEAGLWAYQDLFGGLTLSAYGAVGPYTDGNFRKTTSLSAAYRLVTDPLLLKLKYSFYYLGYRTGSAALQDLPPGSLQLYFDPIAFKNHSWGVVLEKNFGDWLKFSLESDIQLTPGAPGPGFLALAEMDVLLTRQLSLRLVAFYNNSVSNDKTSYQVRNLVAGLAYRF
jgi:tetratricopeptide (TPR) repeat protein